MRNIVDIKSKAVHKRRSIIAATEETAERLSFLDCRQIGLEVLLATSSLFMFTMKKLYEILSNKNPFEIYQKIRLERDVDRYIIELNYVDEMGISADIAAKVNQIGVNIGEAFNENIKRKFVFEVEF